MISKVLLIMPNFNWKVEFDIQKDPPMGLLYIAASLEQHGLEVQITDANAENLSMEEIIERIKDLAPDLVGISANYSPLNNPALMLSKRIKQYRKDLIIAIGGNHATASAGYMLENSENSVDFIMMGQGEKVFINLIDGLNAGKNLSEIRGISYMSENQTVCNDREDLIKDLDSLPVPAYHLLKMDLYDRYNIITSRGCPYKCNYCASNVICSKVAFRSPSKIVREMEYLLENYGAKHFWFSDDTFTSNYRHTSELLDGIIEKNLDISWSCLTRVNKTDKALLAKMKQAGCRYISYGIEGGDQAMLDSMNKKITLEEIREAMLITKEAGIDMYAFFLIGYPGETLETVEQSFKLIKETRPTGVSFAIVIPLPGTTLWDYLSGKGHISYESMEWDYLFAKSGKGKYENYAALLASSWCGIGPEELVSLCKKGEALRGGVMT